MHIAVTRIYRHKEKNNLYLREILTHCKIVDWSELAHNKLL